jgi:uncharacterized phage protein gp47/JayE
MRRSLTNFVRSGQVHFDAVVEDFDTVLVRTSDDAGAEEETDARWKVRNDVSVGKKKKQK